MRLISLVASLGLFIAISAQQNLRGDVDSQDLFIYPETFGNYSLSSCGDAPSCGTKLASYKNINAFSNGKNQCTGNSCSGYGTYGYKYQCVELAQRFFAKKYGTTPIWHANAIDLCNTHPSGVTKTSKPIAGDLVVLKTGTYGHVAVITSIKGDSIHVIEQNSSPSGKNTYSKSGSIACYLHAKNNKGYEDEEEVNDSEEYEEEV
mmetsp:Transcript_1197/g.1948  ORF Transcript_1197/g.1948 Transcript_1197/m.1948 type:complete len:205 (+) Transcript_1197:50-664(+)